MIIEGVERVVERVVERSNTRPNMKVAKPPVFNGKTNKVGGFIIVCRLYLKMKMRGAIVENQVQLILSYV